MAMRRETGAQGDLVAVILDAWSHRAVSYAIGCSIDDKAIHRWRDSARLQTSFLETQNSIGRAGEVVGSVGYDEHCRSRLAAHATDRGSEIVAQSGVEMGERLVEQQAARRRGRARRRFT